MNNADRRELCDHPGWNSYRARLGTANIARFSTKLLATIVGALTTLSANQTIFRATGLQTWGSIHITREWRSQLGGRNDAANHGARMNSIRA